MHLQLFCKRVVSWGNWVMIWVMKGLISCRWDNSLSLNALLKHWVNSLRIFRRTRRKAGVKYLNSLWRQMRTGLRMTLSLSSLERRSLGCCSCLRSSLRHLEAVFRTVLSTRMIISKSLKMITNRFLRISQLSWLLLSLFLEFFLQTWYTLGSKRTLFRNTMMEDKRLLQALVFRSMSSMLRLYSSSLKLSLLLIW